jgi:predicted phosphohydrolase
MLHFPPFSETGEKSGFSERFKEAGVQDVVYGHLHGVSHRFMFNGESDGVRYYAVPADFLNFIPKRIL